MKKLVIPTLLAIIVALSFSLNLSAQDQPVKVVFVNGQAIINAHPSGQAAEALRQQARNEVAGLQGDLEPYVAKAQSGQDLTADERSAFAQLSQTLEAVQVRYQNDIAAAAQPAILAADQAIRAISETYGYTIVLDGTVAQQTGLVVYATSGLDITQQVVDYINQSQ